MLSVKPDGLCGCSEQPCRLCGAKDVPRAGRRIATAAAVALMPMAVAHEQRREFNG